MFRSESFSRRMAVASPTAFVVVAGLVAFMAYCCVYAFRKPFTAGTYAGLELWGVQFKIVLVMAQVAGYALSKFIGIRVISGMTAQRRVAVLLGMTGVAAISLLGFALTPFPWNVLWMFVNGLPLGMAWGLIFSYLEGRRVTEALAALLCVNFIISSGFVKTTGKWLLDAQGVGEQWMPFVAGLLFLPGLLLCLWVLEHLPPPSEADKAQRTPRQRMTPAERRALFFRYAPGLVLLVAIYLALTVVRDVRDNFAVELWDELGYGGQAAILTLAEIPVAVLSLLTVGAMMFVRNNFRALWLNHAFTAFGAGLLLVGTLLYQSGAIAPLLWMIVSGFGLFLPYILFNGVVFDRLLASFHERGNVGFLMYMADSIGYLGSVAVLLWRNFGAGQISWLEYYTKLCYGGAGLMLVLTAGSYFYFLKKRSEQFQTDRRDTDALSGLSTK
ncbi:MAG: hypothetical protein EPGJADBJ_00581 [Saprospiraceae bacterium]|nr:hypothetical protein [Saprospiraceae bacterium]